MDSQLAGRLNQLNEQNDKLTEAEKMALQLDAHEKVLYSQLLLKLIDVQFIRGIFETYVWRAFRI